MTFVKDISNKIRDLVISIITMPVNFKEYRSVNLGKIFSVIYNKETFVIIPGGDTTFIVFDDITKTKISKLKYEPVLRKIVYITEQGGFICSLSESLEKLNDKQLEKIYFLLS